MMQWRQLLFWLPVPAQENWHRVQLVMAVCNITLARHHPDIITCKHIGSYARTKEHKRTYIPLYLNMLTTHSLPLYHLRRYPNTPSWLLTVSHSDAQSNRNSQAFQTFPSITLPGRQNWGKSTEFSFRITRRGFHNRTRKSSLWQIKQADGETEKKGNGGGETEEVCKSHSLASLKYIIKESEQKRDSV